MELLTDTQYESMLNNSNYNGADLRAETEEMLTQYQPLIKATVVDTVRKLQRESIMADADDVESDANLYFTAVYQRTRYKAIGTFMKKAMWYFSREYMRRARTDRKRRPRNFTDAGVTPESLVDTKVLDNNVTDYLHEINCPYANRVGEEISRLDQGFGPTRNKRYREEVKPAVRKWLLDRYPTMNYDNKAVWR